MRLRVAYGYPFLMEYLSLEELVTQFGFVLDQDVEAAIAKSAELKKYLNATTHIRSTDRKLQRKQRENSQPTGS